MFVIIIVAAVVVSFIIFNFSRTLPTPAIIIPFSPDIAAQELGASKAAHPTADTGEASQRSAQQVASPMRLVLRRKDDNRRHRQQHPVEAVMQHHGCLPRICSGVLIVSVNAERKERSGDGRIFVGMIRRDGLIRDGGSRRRG